MSGYNSWGGASGNGSNMKCIIEKDEKRKLGEDENLNMNQPFYFFFKFVFYFLFVKVLIFSVDWTEGNSFQKKITILFGGGNESHGNQGGGATQRASALAALNSTFNAPGGGGKGPAAAKGSSAGSQRRAAVAALSGVLTDEKAKVDEPSPDSPVTILEKKRKIFIFVSTKENQNTVAKLITSMFNSLKGRIVQGRIYQEKEPPQFIAIFQPMVLVKGGLSSSYKSYIAEKGVDDETYSPDSASII
ncbi:hypothetical protein L1987_04282 [Smallanthus sonchifolius]|uniref:Uncharacterized protein n=1 Tax=Smallanthus sonchifolius TaxID=185202 RepID=A0ACB9KCZ3_9ASTR|nr:hypothetical protein L1987_04282 [Smallanthus sonchifolius]